MNEFWQSFSQCTREKKEKAKECIVIKRMEKPEGEEEKLLIENRKKINNVH